MFYRIHLLFPSMQCHGITYTLKGRLIAKWQLGERVLCFMNLQHLEHRTDYFELTVYERTDPNISVVNKLIFSFSSDRAFRPEAAIFADVILALKGEYKEQ